ncbi:MAG TPA: glycosyltransferase family 4 protein [Rhodothermales bacterium]|nr:glycosyltransferase family 4 protein [Rhodothermales bacterium]
MKRVLVISYYFPPSGGPGVQRVLKFVKYLPDFGWQPTVLTVRADHASYPDLDPTLSNEVPASIPVVKTRSWDPYAFYARLQGKSTAETVGVGFIKEGAEGWIQRLAKWVRANLFLPDARVGWVPFALHAAKQMMQQEPFDVVLTSGPPHSTHLVGRALKRRFGCQWVVDMRDPWTDISYYKELPHTTPALRIDAALERSVLGMADAVISVSDGVGDLLKAKAALHHYETVPNGYDPADIPPADANINKQPDRFVIAHVGTLTAQQHAPGFVQALAGRAAADPAWRAQLELRFVGHVDATILVALQEVGLGDAVRLVPYVPHAEAIRHMREADLLMVAVQDVQHNEGVTPAKMFEYLSIGTPLLGLAPPDGDLAAILRETGGGAVFDHHDAAGIAQFMTAQVTRVRNEEAPPRVDAEALRNYDRRVLTQRLAALFDDLTNPA